MVKCSSDGCQWTGQLCDVEVCIKQLISPELALHPLPLYHVFTFL